MGLLFYAAGCGAFLGLVLAWAAMVRIWNLRKPQPVGEIVSGAILAVVCLVIGLGVAGWGSYAMYQMLSR